MEKVIDLINDPVLPIRCFRCKTKESAVDLLNELSKLGYKWSSGHNLTCFDEWCYYHNDTCYFLDDERKKVGFCCLSRAVEMFDYVFEYNSDCIKQ